MENLNKNIRANNDIEIENIVNYVNDEKFNPSAEAYTTARYCLMDTLGCGVLALNFPDCKKLLGPLIEGSIPIFGSRVPGTSFILDPIKAAWDIGCIIRWLDYNDTWLAAEWGHPSDNLGAILSIYDHLSQKYVSHGKQPFLMKDVLHAMIQAHEIQGVIALENSFNKVGLDHVILVKVASAAVITKVLGGNKQQIFNAISQAWLDGHSLRTYRHAPNAGSRKSWAAGDATSRGLFLAMLSMKDEMGYPNALTAPKWGFYDVLFQGKKFSIPQQYKCYVMENILFKVSFPAEFHAQTAAEAAIKLRPQTKDRIADIQKIVVTTHEAAIRIINKEGPLHNPADRDHCLQYIIAVCLLKGALTADDYEDIVAQDYRIDALRKLMVIKENPQYSKDYLDPQKRSIANKIQIYFKDGTSTTPIEVEYPLGHRFRREEAFPSITEKFKNNMATCFPQKQYEKIMGLCLDEKKLSMTPVNKFLELWKI